MCERRARVYTETCISEMEAEDRGAGGGGLIPGLFKELVLAHVVPRLPWYTRPVCRAISKSWRALIDTCRNRPELHELKSRKYQLPLLDGLFLICTFDTHIFISTDRVPLQEPRARYYTVQWQSDTYQIHRQWRKLPPLQELLPPRAQTTLLASSGMLYVWSNEKESNFVLKLDMGCGDWTWNKFPIPHHFNANAIHFNGKIYVPPVPTGGLANQEKEMVVVYDMMTDQYEWVEAWNCDYLRVLQKKSSCSSSRGKEELYNLVEPEWLTNPKLEVHVYDACRDSWRTQANIPLPEGGWVELVEIELLNGDCFEPAPETGINIVWVDHEGQRFCWFNPFLHETWVDIDYNAYLEGRFLDYMEFIGGSVYGIFCEDKGGEDDKGEENKDGQEEEDRRGEEDPRLLKRTLMKGTIHVASGIVIWEDVKEVGCWKERYHVVNPIEHFTIMA